MKTGRRLIEGLVVGESEAIASPRQGRVTNNCGGAREALEGETFLKIP